MLTRQTIHNGAVGAVVGSVLGFIPLVLIVASLLGGGVAGYLKRDGASHGVVAGGIVGLLMAVITGTILFVRFGDLPMDFGTIPLEGLAIASALSLVASIGQIVIADLGSRPGGILETDRLAANVREYASEKNELSPWEVSLGVSSPAWVRSLSSLPC